MEEITRRGAIPSYRPEPVPSDGKSDTPTYGLERPGAFGLSLLGEAASAPLKVAGAGLGLLGEITNASWETITGEVAEARLNAQMRGRQSNVDQKYIEMVNNGMSVSEVGDIMANENVGLTGGVPYDLLAGVFLDPFNAYMLAAGKAWDVGRKASDIRTRLTASGTNAIIDGPGGVKPSPSEQEWLRSGHGKMLLANIYERTSKGLGGFKRGVAESMFGRTAGPAVAAVGVKFLQVVLKYADQSGKTDDVITATGVGSHNIMSNAGAELVVQRAFGSNRAVAMRKAEIIANSKGVNDLDAKAVYSRYVTQDTGSYVATAEDIDEEWKILHEVFDSAGKSKSVLTEEVLTRDVAGTLNEAVGQGGRDLAVRVARTQDDVYVRRVINARKESYVTENMFLLQDAASSSDAIAIAKAEWVRNLGGLMGEGAAAKAFDELAATLPRGGDGATRQLAEAIYASQVIHMGSVASVFGSAKKSLLARISGPGREQALAALPIQTRNIILEQSERWTLVSKDTMTNRDYDELVKILSGEASAATKAQAAVTAVYRFSNLRNGYRASAFEKLARENPEEAVKALSRTLKEYGDSSSFPVQVPIDTFKGADEVLPELRIMREAADSGEYRLIFEPTTVATRPRIMYADQGSKDTVRYGVDLWVPITNDATEVALGNRNLLGRAIDLLTSEKIPTAVVANTLSRMQQYVIEKKIPLSRNQVIALHKKLVQRGFESRGSIRTAFDDANESVTTNSIIDDLIADVSKTDSEGASVLRQMRHNGTLRQMVYWAAEGDLSKVGLATKATGRLKRNKSIGSYATTIADRIYPELKFRVNPIFSAQEIIESKWWNGIRGYQDETKFKIPGTDFEIKYGNQRYYKVKGRKGEDLELDAVEILAERQINERMELKVAQEMFSIAYYINGQATDAIIRFGEDAVGFNAALAGIINRNPGPIKNLDYLKYVAAENVETLDRLGNTLESTIPDHWNTWLAMAGGNRRAASLLFIRERQYLTRNTSTARSLWQANKHYGVGFGRDYDDDPIKMLAVARKEFTKKLKSASPDKLTKVLDELSTQLGVIHGSASAIGYSGESLKSIRAAMNAVEELRNGLKLTVKNKLSNKTAKRVSELAAALQDAKTLDGVGILLRPDFERAVLRKSTVRKALEDSGVPKQMAAEMATLFVVAERRSEMLPQVSLALSRHLDEGAALTPEIIDGMKDHLMRIRIARGEEETLWNALDYALEAAQRNADATHYFPAGRGFLEKTLNHPVFSFYPTSYMFGKVMPEYSRMLFLSPNRGITSFVTAPYTAVMKGLGWAKFTNGEWGRYAPLVGFNAATKIRDAMLETDMQDDGKINPLVYLLANVLIPGLPTEISVSAPAILYKPIAAAVEDLETSGTIDPGNVLGEFGFAAAKTGERIVGFKTGFEQIGRAAGFVAQEAEDAGGPVEYAGKVLGDLTQGVTDFLQNK